MTIEPADAPNSDPRLLGPAARAPAPAETAGEVRYTVLSPKAIWTAATLILLIGVGVAVWLLLAYGGGGQQLEAIRTAGTIVVGTGGAAALVLAARRQRSAEIALKQKDRDQADVAQAHALQERVAAATELDAVERRVTELYTKAADQLGSDKAPVRLAGLYALERLAQNNPAQRQTVVNVLCAYLRMPYQPPRDSPPDDADDAANAAHRERVQERQVRLTAQRLLRDHLGPGSDPVHPAETFWADIDLDLTDAYLINFILSYSRIRNATFSAATFASFANFTSSTVAGHGDFDSATFTGDADFIHANFVGHGNFDSATFANEASFTSTTFAANGLFASAKFTGNASFNGASFAYYASFDAATFAANAVFTSTTFNGATFDSANFVRGVPPEVARFLPTARTKTLDSG